jgi:protein tyrosine phosphatase
MAHNVVRETTSSNNESSSMPPIIIHCVDGASQSGLFCAAWNVCEKMKIDHEVDVFHTVKAIKLKRFHFVNSLVNIITVCIGYKVAT